VKRIKRAVAAALVAAAAGAAALLSSPPAAHAASGRPATPAPPLPSAALTGTWVNVNHATRSAVAFVVAGNGARGVLVDGFGACTPVPCEWGRIPGTVFGSSASATSGTFFEAQWNFGFSRTVVLATYSAPRRVPTLTVHELTTFTDGSGRANYAVTETFTRGRAIAVHKIGTSAANYPLGDSVHPVPSLPATWIDLAPGAGLRAVVLTAVNGLLHVHAYGNCSPVPCNWGTVTGITFGASVSAATGDTFLAPYAFGFARKLLEGSVNAAGTRLTVRTWTEFTDGSHRSNYVITDTFIPLR
jgi:hypothetical protein